MRKIGIIAAMQEEMEAIKEIMTEITIRKIYELVFFEGKINKKECVLVECGVGKVNSSRTTQILIDKFEIEYIINVGSAATANDNLDIGDIVLGKDLIQHDFDITAFGHPKGYISNIGVKVQSDEELINKFEEATKKIEQRNYKIKIGTIASGDIFCTEIKMKQKINSKFNADAIEMEGAAIAQVCHLDKVPFIIVRSISDNPNGNNNITFDEYFKLAAKRCSEILKNVI